MKTKPKTLEYLWRRRMELDSSFSPSCALSHSSPLLLLFYFHGLRMEWEEVGSGFKGVILLECCLAWSCEGK